MTNYLKSIAPHTLIFHYEMQNRENCLQILNFLKISETTVRIEILNIFLLKPDKRFTVTDIQKILHSRKITIGASTINATVLLFKTRGILIESDYNDCTTEQMIKKGRPALKFQLSKATIYTLLH